MEKTLFLGYLPSSKRKRRVRFIGIHGRDGAVRIRRIIPKDALFRVYDETRIRKGFGSVKFGLIPIHEVYGLHILDFDVLSLLGGSFVMYPLGKFVAICAWEKFALWFIRACGK